MDSIRRNLLATGAAATAMAAAPRAFAQQTAQGGAAMSFYERGAVRIAYEEAGSGIPLMLIAGGIHRDELMVEGAIDPARLGKLLAAADVATTVAAMPELVW